MSQHNKVCLTTEEAKAVYECLNQDKVVSPIHFDKDLPKLHSIREAAYAKLEHILEEEGPLNPYEHALLHPNHEFPTKTPEIEDFYDMHGQGPKTPNTQNMEDWSILSTEIHYAHQKSTGTSNLLVLGGQEKLLQEWVSSENAPKLQATNLPDTPLIKAIWINMTQSVISCMTQNPSMTTEMFLLHIFDQDNTIEQMNSNLNYLFL